MTSLTHRAFVNMHFVNYSYSALQSPDPPPRKTRKFTQQARRAKML